MSVTSWFRKLFTPGMSGNDSSGTHEPSEVGMAGAPGVTPFARLEDAQAVEAVEKSTEPPADSEL